MTRCAFTTPISGGIHGGGRCPNDTDWFHESRSSATSANHGRFYCKRHLTVMRKRDDKALAPHVHKAWASTVKARPGGTTFRFCADCGAPF